MNRILVCLVLGVFLVGMVGAAEPDSNKVSKEVVDNFKNGAEKVRVVIKINDANNNPTIKTLNSDNAHISSKYIVDEISPDELETLSSNSSVEKILPENLLHAFLQESTGIIKSDLTNNLKTNNINLTGTEQTVCIIDTGVNFLHADLLGKNESCVVDCFDKACVENCSVGDNHGHGTHVAGIVAASGGITGIAPNVSLIGVKILGSDGYGSGNSNDLSNAIDWCADHNATVITMSLGTDFLYDSSCDGAGALSSWKNSINSAVSQNISVIAASGNAANHTHISAPACLSNAIAVGDTYDADIGTASWSACTDTTTTLDKIVCHANRNPLVKLFAPGAMINSTWENGAYEEAGGTSMAAPMVAGAIALINQYLDSTGQSKTPSEIEDILNDTGEVVDDSAGSGYNFSRINVYDALLSFGPIVTLVSPSNNYIAPTENQTFSCNVTDLQLVNATFKLWDSSGNLINTTTQNISGSENQTSFNMTNLSAGEYEWNCFTSDEQGNIDSASSNFTFIVKIATYLNSPQNNTHTNVNQTTFNCTSKTANEYELTNITFNLYNSTNNLVNTSTQNISGAQNTTTFNYTFQTEDDYHWECISYNNNSDTGDGINYTITYDKTSPAISSLNANPARTSATITWTTNEPTNSLLNASAGTWTNSSNYTTSHSITISGLSASTPYTYTVQSCDQSTNCNTSSGSFTTDAASSGGSSGGSSTPSTQTINIGTEELFSGKTQDLGKGDKITFSLTSGSHSLELEKVTEDSAQIIIRSDPINLTLKTGEETKLNLSSPYFYDLIVKLNDITNEKANITIKRIFEEIKIETPDEDIVYHIMDDENASEETTEDEEFETLLGGNVVLDFIGEEGKGSLFAIAIIIAAIVFALRLKKKKIKSTVSSKE